MDAITMVTTKISNMATAELPMTERGQYVIVGKHLGKFHQVYGDIHGYLSVVVCTFGLIANMLNIAVLSKKQMVNPTNIILIGLAIADVLVMASYLVFAFYMYIPTMKESVHLYGWAVFVLFHFNLTMTAHTISSWVTVFLAAFRCLSIFKPLIRKRFFDNRTTIICLVILYLLVIISCLPYYMSYIIVPSERDGVVNLSTITESRIAPSTSHSTVPYQVDGIGNLARDEMYLVKRYDYDMFLQDPIANQLHHQRSLVLTTAGTKNNMASKLPKPTTPKSQPKDESKHNRALTESVFKEVLGNHDTTLKGLPQRYITTQNSKHSNLVLMNFIMYSVVGKLLPCLLLTVMSALLIWVVYKANSKHKKLKGNARLKLPNAVRHSHAMTEMPSHVTHALPTYEEEPLPLTMTKYEVENSSGVNQCLYNTYHTKPSLDSLKFETTDEVTALVGPPHKSSLKSEKTSLLNTSTDESMPLKYTRPSGLMNKKLANDMFQTIHEDMPTQSIPDDDDNYQATGKGNPDNPNYSTYKYIKNKMKSGMAMMPLRKHSTRRKESVGRYRGDKTSQLLLTVLLFFLLTEFPSGILSLLCIENILGTPFFLGVYSPLGDLMDMMALINSSTNFIVYCTMSQQFREAFAEMMANTYRSLRHNFKRVKNSLCFLICSSKGSQKDSPKKLNGNVAIVSKNSER